ncbi:hypothetical protein BCR35DRAFT_293970 [Leucosporidium creatinivorum]|uniref:Uncharacterized protein n=1 Tax=Leucosporidium creatinivorum TaxID=106004 RepID=A0A1Y2EMX7_9BASI|nr:hypothetical protein BCR35DRAFT_293970 [Leucosporidium creatinivorum]
MAVRHVLDDYYLAITFLVSLALQLSLFLVSFTLQTDKLTDFGGSINFLLLAFLTLFLGNESNFVARNIIASVFVMIWSIRLGGFLFFRVLKTGKDGRFDEMRAHFFKFAGFWTFQLFWVWTVSLPVTILNSPNVSDAASGGGHLAFGTAGDIIGVILFALGFLLEAIADQQKYLFKSSKPPKGAIMTKGVWRFMRHPNYTGEICLWWGIWALCVSPATHGVVSGGGRKALIASVLGPVFISLLLFFVSGLPPSEKPTAKKYYLMSHGANPESGDKWAEYKAYLNRTSIFFPIPPSLYRPIPAVIKQTLLLDFPMFKFDEHKDGKEAVEEERRKNSEQGGEA